MNVLLWVLQCALAFVFLSGGAYKIFQFDQLAGMPAMGALPKSVWMVVAVVEIVGAVMLIVPGVTGWMPGLTAVAAGVLAAESLVLAALYARYSLQIAATNPMVWAAAMGLVAGVVACGRFARG